MRKLEQAVLPTEEEKDASIQFILANGMPEPQRLPNGLFHLWRSIGFRGLFFGVEDCAFVGILSSMLVWGWLFSSLADSQSILCVLLFLASPLIYALLHLLTVWKEIMVGTYELKMACRYSLRQMTALRMLVFGGISVVLSVLASVGIWLLISQDIPILRMMSISFSALFLFAAMQLFAEWKWKVPLAYFLTPVVWCTICAVFLAIGEPVEQLLLQIPTIVFWAVAAGAAVVYFWTLKYYYFDSKEGALSHVVG